MTSCRVDKGCHRGVVIGHKLVDLTLLSNILLDLLILLLEHIFERYNVTLPLIFSTFKKVSFLLRILQRIGLLLSRNFLHIVNFVSIQPIILFFNIFRAFKPGGLLHLNFVMGCLILFWRSIWPLSHCHPRAITLNPTVLIGFLDRLQLAGHLLLHDVFVLAVVVPVLVVTLLELVNKFVVIFQVLLGQGL